MSFVVAKCKHSTKKYCKNWDGKGNQQVFVELSGVASDQIQCPPNRSKCSFMVTPTPSPILKAK